jgi:PadR family transcriptional regulator, regulatory protein PadR
MPRKDAELLQGTLDMLILKAVSLQPLHGYGILLRIEQLSKDRLQIQQGSLYPALYRLEHRGWIAAEWGESENKRKAKYYKLTAAGRRQLRAETESWNRLTEAIAGVMDASVEEL